MAYELSIHSGVNTNVKGKMCSLIIFSGCFYILSSAVIIYNLKAHNLKTVSDIFHYNSTEPFGSMGMK